MGKIPWRQDGEYGVKVTKDGKQYFYAYGKEVLLVAKQLERETKKQYLILKIKIAEKWIYLTIPRGDLTRKNCKELMDKGIDVTEATFDTLVATIMQQEKDVKIISCHKGLGFTNKRGVKSFKTNDAVYYKKEKQIPSKYNGDIKFEGEGDLSEWVKMANEYCVTHTPLAFIIAVSISSMLVGFFENLSESMIIHLFNQSSKGKSTAAKLAASLFYKPTFQSNSLLTTWNNTENYIMGLLDKNNGVIAILDETSVLRSKDISNFLYTLSSGVEKGRMSSNAELKECRTWKTVILSTGEMSLDEITNQNDGLKVRVFNFGNISWTKDAKHAESIQKCIDKNYGLAAKEIAKYLIDEDYDTLEKEYEECVVEYESKCEVQTHLTHRIAKKLGLILYGAKLANKVLGLQIDTDKVLDFMVENQSNQAADQAELSIEDKAFEYVLSEVSKNRGRFSIDKVSKKTMKRTKEKAETIQDISTNALGKIWEDEVQNVRWIGFYPDELKNLLNKGGYKSPTTILKKWKEKELLETDGDRLTKIKTIRTGEKVRLNVLIQKNYLEEQSEEKANDDNVSKKEDENKMNAIITDILSEDDCA